MKCICQSPLTHRQIAIISGDMVLWHSRCMFTSLMHSLLCTTVVGYREFCPSTPILIAKMGFDRHHGFHHSICQPVLFYPLPSRTRAFNRLLRELKQNTTCKQPSYTQGQEHGSNLCNVLKFGKGKREGGSVFEMQSWAECQFTSKTAIKRHWAMFHSAFTQRL